MATWRRTRKTRWRKPNGPRPDNALPFQRLSRTGYTSSITDPPLASGMVLPMIDKLLGHGKIQTTARYAHLARDSVKESAARSQTVAPLRARRIDAQLVWAGCVCRYISEPEIPPGISGWSILSRPGSQAAGRSRGVSGRESCHRRLVTG